MRRSVSGACDIVAVLLTRERRCTVIEHALDTVTCVIALSFR